MVLHLKAAREVWENVFKKNAAPNGGIMRTSVLGIFEFLNEDAVVGNTREMCMVTHTDPRLEIFFLYPILVCM